MAIVVAAIMFAIGQALEAAPVVKAVQTVTVQRCNGNSCTQVRQFSPGSGTCIGRDKSGRLLILTCAHGWTKNGETFAIIDGAKEKAAIIGFDGKRDLCLLATDHPAPVLIFPVAESAPSIGTQVSTQGIPGDGKLRTVQTRVKGYTADKLITAATFRQEESGGAVICGNELVGVILATSHFDGLSAHVRTVQDFLIDSLGYIPLTSPPPAEKPAEVPPAEKLEPIPHPEPLPAPAVADAPAPAPAGTSSDDVRNIVTTELSKLGPDIKAELVKQWGLHAADIKSAVTTSISEGKIDPAAFAPVLKTAAQGAAKDVGAEVVKQVAPSLLGAIASHLGAGALAGSIGGPVGAAAGAAIGIVGFFLNRTLKKRMPALTAAPPPSAAWSGPLPSAQIVTPFPIAVPSAPTPQAVIPERTFQQIEVDRTAQALDWAMGELVKRYPASEGTVSTLQSLVSQFKSGAQPNAS
ncbi:MAG: trypsin-like peptidase domain-containing protein [Elusimicrobia bacterium]|nr:trypsin-like peptidase domain-containing protein [Elusimicrobiota bacterium]